jgi:hypothetical protein
MEYWVFKKDAKLHYSNTPLLVRFSRCREGRVTRQFFLPA